MPEQFLDEERVSVRVLGDVPREPGRRLLPGLDGDQGSDVRLAEPFEAQLMQCACASSSAIAAARPPRRSSSVALNVPSSISGERSVARTM